MSNAPHATLAAALVAAQSEMVDPRKNADNPHFRSKYADLPEVLGIVRPVFARHGLALWSGLDVTPEGHALVVLDIIHGGTGEKLRSAAPVPPSVLDNPQKVGSFVSYMRRYLTQAAANIAADDDDANMASSAPRSVAAPATSKSPAVKSAAVSALKAEIEAASTLEVLTALRPRVVDCADNAVRKAYAAKHGVLSAASSQEAAQ